MWEYRVGKGRSDPCFPLTKLSHQRMELDEREGPSAADRLWLPSPSSYCNLSSAVGRARGLEGRTWMSHQHCPYCLLPWEAPHGERFENSALTWPSGDRTRAKGQKSDRVSHNSISRPLAWRGVVERGTAEALFESCKEDICCIAGLFLF